MKKYKGKISILAAVLLFLLIGGLGHFTFNSVDNWVFRILYIIGVMIFLHIVFAKKYLVNQEFLQIKMAGFRNQIIPISKIHKIERLQSPIDSLFKLDRIVIYYNKNNDFEYLRTPNKLNDFINQLSVANSNIEIDPDLNLNSNHKESAGNSPEKQESV